MKKKITACTRCARPLTPQDHHQQRWFSQEVQTVVPVPLALRAIVKLEPCKPRRGVRFCLHCSAELVMLAAATLYTRVTSAVAQIRDL